MKFLQAYRDNSGFHYLVQLDGPHGQVLDKPFNYGPPPGTIYMELAVSEENDTSRKIVEVAETEDDYQKRIEEEIEATARQIEEAWRLDPKTGGLSAGMRTDLLQKKKSESRL